GGDGGWERRGPTEREGRKKGVPQVSSLHRLAGQAATVLPQVKPLARSSLLVRLYITIMCQGQQNSLSLIVTAAASNVTLHLHHHYSQQSNPTELHPHVVFSLSLFQKIAFMVALGLVTTEHLEEIQMKRQERKRRSTANPAYSGLFEPERKRLASHYLNSSLFLSARGKEQLTILCLHQRHDDHCAVCKEDGELQQCHNCPRAFHPTCLHPPLKTPPRGPWYCPKCQKKVRPSRCSSHANAGCAGVPVVPDRKLLFCFLLLQQCMDLRERLLGQQRDTQASLDRLKTLIRLIQRDQLIQVTMTTTATIATSLLSQSWIKSTSTAAAATPRAPRPCPCRQATARTTSTSSPAHQSSEIFHRGQR
uniref:PHD finger protein 21B n=1 Tax=Oreochromis niloticus TaxID=8128 RepID=A0A669EL56_ORENI